VGIGAGEFTRLVNQGNLAREGSWIFRESS